MKTKKGTVVSCRCLHSAVCRCCCWMAWTMTKPSNDSSNATAKSLLDNTRSAVYRISFQHICVLRFVFSHFTVPYYWFFHGGKFGESGVFTVVVGRIWHLDPPIRQHVNHDDHGMGWSRCLATTVKIGGRDTKAMVCESPSK